MKHRHLDTSEWTLAAIDSVLDRGDLPDWRDLFAAVAADRVLAEKVLRVANKHRMGGTSVLAAHLVKTFHPQISDS